MTVFDSMRGEVSAASGAVFRIGFGTVGLILVIRYFAHGWIDTLFLEPMYHFSYPGFEWVQPWPGIGMYIHFALLGVAAVGIMLGYRYRLAAALFAVGFAYTELIDRTLYINHYYWLVLTAGLMAFLPLNRMWSFDARRDGRWSPSYPAWVLWMLRFQVGMVYFFAGLAKINSDWLFEAQPLATWLPARSELFLIGPLLAMPATAFVFSWVGMLFDVTIVGWLSWKRTRLPAYLVVVAFHILTWWLFPAIGVFPLIMSVGALVFFDPDWPSRLVSRSPQVGSGSRSHRSRPVWVALAGLYVVAMIALPLRHHFIAGDVKVTGEGYVGAWQVMLTEKSASAEFLVTDAESGSSWRVGPPGYLTQRQVTVMATDPMMIQQTARLVAAEYPGTVVSADVRMAFNGRPSAQYTDPAVVISEGTVPSSRWVALASAD